MALPTILVNSATGSDTAASGAGPGTALTGTAATTDAAGTLVTLDGTPDLSGVATDGSAVVFLGDTTAGARNFGKITAVNNIAKTVTVSNAFRISIPGGDSVDWAIGGKRASIGGTTSAKLFSNNGAVGDAMPGWIVEMESGHAETLAAAYAIRRGGDLTDGPITLRGAIAAATPPVLTFSNNGIAIQFIGGSDGFVLSGFDLVNTNATKTASEGVRNANNGETLPVVLHRIRIRHSTNKFWKGVVATTGTDTTILILCEIAYTASHGVDGADDEEYEACYIHDCGGDGIVCGGAGRVRLKVHDCLIESCTGNGLLVSNSNTTTGNGGVTIRNTTFDNNAGDNLEFASASTALLYAGLTIINCNFTRAGGYGINFSGASVTAALLHGYCARLLHDNYGTGAMANTSGASNLTLTTPVEDGKQTVDPSYTDAANGDFRVGTSVKALGWPTANVGIARSHMDIGALQREEAGAGGGGLKLAGPGGLAG